MAIYDTINLKTLLKEYYGEQTNEYQDIISKINNYDISCINEINEYIEEINEYINIPFSKKQDYVREYLSGNKDAKNDVININLINVVLIAVKYLGNGLSFSDLIQEGNIGLIQAVDRLDTFTQHYRNVINRLIESNIKQAIYEYNKDNFNYEIKERDNTELKKKIWNIMKDTKNDSKYKQIYRELNNNLNNLYNNDEKSPISLNISSGVEDIINIIPDNSYNPENAINNTVSSELISAINQCMTYREKQYVFLKYGLLDNIPKTNMEISKILDITRQRVSELEKQVLKKLRNNNIVNRIYNHTYNNHFSKIDSIPNIEEDKILKKACKYITKIIKKDYPNFNDEEIHKIFQSLSIDEVLKIMNKILDRIDFIEKQNKIIDLMSKENNDIKLEKIMSKIKITSDVVDIISKLDNNCYKLIIECIPYYNKNYNYKFRIVELRNNRYKPVLNIEYTLNDNELGFIIIESFLDRFVTNNKITSKRLDKLGNIKLKCDTNFEIVTSFNNKEQEINFINKYNDYAPNNIIKSEKKEIDDVHEKVKIISHVIRELSTLNSNDDCYKLIIEYIPYYDKLDNKNYNYKFKFIDLTNNKYEEILNIDYSLNDHKLGFNIITGLINEFNKNTKIVSVYFDNAGNSNIINDSNFAIITSLEPTEDKYKFINLHNQLKSNVKVKK